MSVLLAISPHLDDAVFSAGAELARRAQAGTRVIVATCFTGNVVRPQGFALACQLDKDLPETVDYMALRRAEDLDACATLGLRAVHLPFLEAPHRGYESAAALFDTYHPDPALEVALEAELTAIIRAEGVDEIAGPAALGSHVDHVLVHRVATGLSVARRSFWADLPYAARTAFDRTGYEARPCGPLLPAKRAAIACYGSQLAFQFRGATIPDHLISIEEAEWFTR